MRKGEKGIFIVMAVVVGAAMIKNIIGNEKASKEKDREIPFYSTMTQAEGEKALRLMDANHCKDCHYLWGTNASFMQNVPAPRLDGIGSIRNEEWFYNYLSSADPQTILPSRLKPEFRMPSYAKLPHEERHEMAKYLASLKVKNWYLTETRKAEYEKLTGKEYHP
jgi:hypothetical protein